jgi:serine protease
MVQDNVRMHVLPARGVIVQDEIAGGITTLSRGAASTSSNVTWHGGPVQHNPKIYVVFWGSGWTTSDPEYTRLVSFFKGLSGSQWNGTVTQYYDGSAHIANDASLAGTWIDTSSIPSRPSSSAVGAEAQKLANHFGYAGSDANYWVALQHGHDPSGFKSQWCAWHSAESENEGVVSFTDFPYQSDAGYSCGSGSVNTPGTYDGVSIIAGHEEAETQTDPQPNTGWIIGNSEIGDLCAWTGLKNTSFSTGTFPTQPLWSNSAGGCVQ